MIMNVDLNYLRLVIYIGNMKLVTFSVVLRLWEISLSIENVVK